MKKPRFTDSQIMDALKRPRLRLPQPAGLDRSFVVVRQQALILF
jgi:hypothetical protein